MSAGPSGPLVIKVGGEIFESDALTTITGEVASVRGCGRRVVMVHGGGPQATAMQRRLGLEPTFVGGRRVTDAASLDVVKMVIGGRLNIEMCAALVRAGVRPVGLSGSSSMVVRAVKRPPRVVDGGGPEPVDFGWVGDITGVDVALLTCLLDAGHVPVLTCIGADDQGQVFNINTDVIANHVAAALQASALVLVTGAPGVMRDIDDPGSRIPTLRAAEAEAAIADGTVVGGMIPKLVESIGQLRAGKIGAVHIVGDLQPGQLATVVDEPGTLGTTLLP